MGDGSKFWAGDILTSLGLTVDEGIEYEQGENANGKYYKLPGGLVICFMSMETYHDINTSFYTPYEYSVPPVSVASIYRPGGYDGIGVMIKAITTSHVSVKPYIVAGNIPETGIKAQLITIGY